MAEVIEGMDDAIKSFKRMAEAAKPRVMRSALNAALTPGLKAARNAAPRGEKPHKTYKGRTVAPGFLSRSMRKSTRTSRDKKKVIGKIAAHPEAFYGAFGEHGTKKQDADPFFFDAINGAGDEMQRRYFEKMNERILKEFRR